MTRRIMALGLLIVLTAGPARSEEVTLNIHDVTVVQDGEGHARLLFRVDSLPTSTRLHIDRAVLTVRYSGNPSERSTELRVCPVSGTLAGGGDWNTPFEEELYARAEWDLRSESGTLRFDVTGAFRAARAAGTPLDGFVLTATGVEGGLPVSDLERLSGLQGATMRVMTTNLPSGLPPQAYRERHTG